MQSASPQTTVKVAAVQASPVFLDKKATTQKVCDLILRAGEAGAEVIGFPETFIPGYPGWVELLPVRAEPSMSLYVKLFNEAVEVPGPETETIGAACKEADVYAVVGINERRPNTTGTLWNTSLFFGKDGSILHKHQKYVPTVGERLIHAPGQTGSDATVRTSFGGLSSLICGENGNTLAQYSISLEYPVVHVASWPPHFSLGADVGDTTKVFSSAIASSVGCYVINSVALLDKDAIEAYGATDEVRAFLQNTQQKRQATIIGPGGVVLTEQTGEELLYAEVDLEAIKRTKYGLDYAGHYNRPELFAHHFKQYM